MGNLELIKTIKRILVIKKQHDELSTSMEELDTDELFKLVEASVKAKEFLCENDFDAIEQVLAIQRAHTNFIDTLIDSFYVVTVLEQYEHQFTGKDFLTKIGLL